jgi:hypothetical protein
MGVLPKIVGDEETRNSSAQNRDPHLDFHSFCELRGDLS